MTYEQAGHGRAGLGIQTDEGFVLTLVDRLNHHTTTGLSTVEIASKNGLTISEKTAKALLLGPDSYRVLARKCSSLPGQSRTEVRLLHRLHQCSLLRWSHILSGILQGGVDRCDRIS